MLSFFCAGIPSRAGAEKILEELGTDPGSVAAFRYRGNGWPGRACATLKDGSERSMSYFDSWGGFLSDHLQLRCKICADGTGKAADLAFADAWETDAKGYPLFEERDGVSLIVARTAKGAGLLKDSEAAGRLATAAFDLAALDAMQPGQSGRRKALLARLAGLWVLGRTVPRYRGLHILKAARRNPPASTFRNFIGMIRRGLTGRV
ncbi:MAG: Coenzyme F420 hydrogenase/dehydrogenase, beta subunit C-terminal domain [Rhodobacteraceae bacterium]|nr:Coenzyme F420 hydrogenase/dehydrogenase, beta subunit C-terminal domain [Paracoccaceae bacterium]